MTNEQYLQEEYFKWLCRLVNGEKEYQIPHRRSRLLKDMHGFEFFYSIPRDGNRFEDGINLRYRYGHETGTDLREIATCLDDKPCSVLEMMIALCLRCEERIMSNDEIGNRTGEWFNAMLQSLDLHEGMDEKTVYDILSRFVRRAYEPDGKGGLFTLHHCQHDMRTAEIWYQAMWYFDEVLQEEGESL